MDPEPRLDTDPAPWYKNAIVYAVDVRRFMDSDGDGWGDLPGLTSKLDYLADLGVTCLWILPVYPSRFRDNGYDVISHYHVDRRLGTLEDLLTMLHEAGERSMRVVLDLILDHTSNEHPWFKAARRDPDSRYREYYSWSDHPPPVPPGEGSIVPGEEESVWTYDDVAGAYYYHRFYHFQPDLNTTNPHVQEEIERLLDFWLSFDVAGFRLDAVPHVISAHGTPETEPSSPHQLLKDIRRFVEERKPTTALIGEADVPPEEMMEYFGDGDELNLLFNFLINKHIFLAFAREEATPIERALKLLPDPPASCQWLNFLRNLDELDLRLLPEETWEEIYEAFAPDEEMRIYGRGIRRRLASMLGGNRDQLKLAFSLLFSLPGTPMITYGDEIGLGDDLSQEGRDAVRPPMPWTDGNNGGFSDADPEALVQPALGSGPLQDEQMSVEAQRNDPDSFLNWVKRLIYTRRSCPEIGNGTWHTVDLAEDQVLALRFSWKTHTVVTVHNISGDAQTVTLDLSNQRGRILTELHGQEPEQQLEANEYDIEMEPYGYRWYRLTGDRSADDLE